MNLPRAQITCAECKNPIGFSGQGPAYSSSEVEGEHLCEKHVERQWKRLVDKDRCAIK